MDIRYDFEGFYEKLTYPMFINSERTAKNRVPRTNLVETLLFLIFSLLGKSIDKEI